MPKKDDKKVKKEDITQVVGDDAVLVTKEGFEKLKDELENLKSVKRREVSARIKEAISYGDLSENSEYEEAKNEQAFVEGRIMELEQQVVNVKIISEHHKAAGVELGSTVTVKNLSISEKEVYTIVGSTEANPFDHKISNESPVGAALLSREKGEKIKVDTPDGIVEYEIVKID